MRATRSAAKSDGSQSNGRAGRVYWIDPNPVAGREMRNRHRFIVITPRQINALGIAMTVRVATGPVGVTGSFHHVSEAYLHRYRCEFDYR